MEIIETKIQKIYVSNNCVTYAFMVDCTKGYVFSVVNYSRECDLCQMLLVHQRN